MSLPVEKITIAGFRGILQPLELDFVKGEPKSMVIYGKNGTGKSSITDACEWFHTENVGHLRREGARERSFPHREADKGETYVKFEFAADDLENSKLTYDNDKVTSPAKEGDVDEFRRKAPHPFYIRFEDLKQFVYKTKTEKYEKLAELMGFQPQVEFQKSLQRVQNQLDQKLDQREKVVEQRKEDLRALLDVAGISESAILNALTEAYSRHDLDEPKDQSDLETGVKVLEKRVENDQVAAKINQFNELAENLQTLDQIGKQVKPVVDYLNESKAFSEKEGSAVDALLIKLYETGRDVLQGRSSGKDSVCPLCDQSYEGDLEDHIQQELSELRALKKAKESLEKQFDNAKTAVQRMKGLVDSFSIEKDISFDEEGLSLSDLEDCANACLQEIKKAEEILDNREEESAGQQASRLSSVLPELGDQIAGFQRKRSALLNAVLKRKEALENKSDRKQLVDDYSKIRDASELYGKLRDAETEHSQLQDVSDRYGTVVKRYVERNMADVKKRFDEISEDVSDYFEILEEDTEGISDPTIQLLTDKDRAVRLKLQFHGEETSPAYKYLSESQLNSFGLAVFLASVKRFNQNFKFIVLDDVINSFDGYKRFKVIDLIRRKLPDCQFLILTHDQVWIKQIADQFSSWNEKRFTRWKPNYGPVVGDSAIGLDYIKGQLEEDRPESAGRELGAFLERQLQILCELFEVQVKYKRNNEYTLRPLFERLRVRVKKKLGPNHGLTNAILDLEQASSFRNFCVHWKNTSSPYSEVEIRTVVDKWERIDSIARCSQCNWFVSYDGKSFSCNCGETVLSRGSS